LRSSYQAEIEQERTKAKQLEEKLNQAVIGEHVSKIAAQHLGKAADLYLQLNKDKFEVVQDENGNFIPRLKNSFQSIEESVMEFQNNYGFAKPNPVKAGSGGRGNNSNEGESGITVSVLEKMSQQERVEAIKKDPTLMKRFMSGQLPNK